MRKTVPIFRWEGKVDLIGFQYFEISFPKDSIELNLVETILVDSQIGGSELHSSTK